MAAPHLTTLPDDVLREIFLWAIAFAEGRLWIKDAPLNLSHACRSLRAFALSQSHFWAHLSFTNAFRNRYVLRKHSLTHLWLTRSSNVLLDFSLDLQGADAQQVVAAAETISLLVTVQSRWKRLVLLYCNKIPADSYDWTVTNLSQLRELVVSYIKPNATKELQTSLLLNGILKLSTIARTQTPIAPRLVHLHIYHAMRISPECLEAMLDHCPALECLSMGLRVGLIWPAREGKGIVGASGTLNRLSRIRISECEWIDLLSFLNDGRAPALDTMEVRVYYEELRALATTLLSPHIGPLIRSASLSFACGWPARPKPGNALDDVLRALPNVTHLHLTVSNKDYVLECLSFGETGCLLLPELEYIKIVASEVRTGVLESMLTSRMLHSDRFRAVIDTSRWTVRRNKMFLARRGIKPWVDSGRLEVIFDDR